MCTSQNIQLHSIFKKFVKIYIKIKNIFNTIRNNTNYIENIFIHFLIIYFLKYLILNFPYQLKNEKILQRIFFRFSSFYFKISFICNIRIKKIFLNLNIIYDSIFSILKTQTRIFLKFIFSN